MTNDTFWVKILVNDADLKDVIPAKRPFGQDKNIESSNCTVAVRAEQDRKV